MVESYTAQELVSKIEWEETIYATLANGLTADAIEDGELGERWEELTELYRDFEAKAEAFHAFLRCKAADGTHCDGEAEEAELWAREDEDEEEEGAREDAEADAYLASHEEDEEPLDQGVYIS